MEALSQCQAAMEETTCDEPQGQITTQYLLPEMRTTPRPSPMAGETAEIKVAQRAIHCRILAPSETLMVCGIVTIILILPGVPTIILKLAMVLAGILILAGSRTGTQTLAAALASEGIETLDGMRISDSTHTAVGEGKLDRGSITSDKSKGNVEDRRNGRRIRKDRRMGW